MSNGEFPIRSLLPSLLLICSYQMSAATLAQTATIVTDGSAYSSVAASGSTPTKSREYAKSACSRMLSEFGVDGTACLSSENGKKQPSQDRDNSPDPASDLDESESGPGDLKPANSSRQDQGTSRFSATSLDADIPRASRLVPVFLLLANCIPCLREHIRERAPPTLV